MMSQEDHIYEWLAHYKRRGDNYSADPPPGAIPFLREQTLELPAVDPPVQGQVLRFCEKKILAGEAGFVQRIRITAARRVVVGGLDVFETIPALGVQGKFFCQPSIGNGIVADLNVGPGGNVDSNQSGLTTTGDFGTLTRMAPIPVYPGNEFYLKVGFSLVGVLPDANGPGKPDIFLAKRVGGRKTTP